MVKCDQPTTDQQTDGQSRVLNRLHTTKIRDKNNLQAGRHTDRPIERETLTNRPTNRDTRFYREMGIPKKTRWLRDEFMT